MSLISRRTVMARKRYKPEGIVAKLPQVDVLVSQGQNRVDAVRQIGVSEVTYYRWRQEFGGLKSEQVKRLKDLELENSMPELFGRLCGSTPGMQHARSRSSRVPEQAS
jgi:putative transposase